MEEIVKLIKNGVVQYPITKPEAVIDETGLSLVQKLEEKANKTEIPTKVSQLENDAEYATKSEIDGKQDEIKDLDAIRSGAAKGATALQSIPAEYVTDDELDNALRPKVNVNQIATINGKSLVNGGNIVITGGEGGGYDDTEIRAELTQLSSEVEEINEKIGNLPQGASMTPITYAELVELRDNGNLVAGSFYRITDYETTTSQENTQSAGHPFDVIVLALSENTLAEEAYAIQSARDTDGYFANSNLAAWKLWYSLDNDTERFAWADEVNGKGVIYRMIDEWNNDVPYDFKNIQFKRHILNADDAFATDVAKGGELEIVKAKLQEMSHKIHTNLWYYGEYVSDVYPDANPETRYVPFGDVNYENAGPQVLCGIDENNYGWFYTFHNEDEDASLLKPNVDESVGVYNNTIKDSCYVFFEEEGAGSYYPTNTNAQSLNNIVFFGNGCYYNSFGNGCHYNSFGNNCHYNSFGNYCYYNSFGNDCNSNSFGNDCNFNSFGNGCLYNSFGNGCYSNSFGNSCVSNSFGNSCGSNSFKDQDGIADNASYNKLDDGVNNIELWYDDNNGNYGELKNHHVCRGCKERQIEIYENRDFETTFAMTSDGQFREYCIADVV